MKRLMRLGMLSVAMLVLMCGAAGAQDFPVRGSAIVPNLLYQFWSSEQSIDSYITITNITNVAVKCRVLVYDHSGNDISSYGIALTGGNGNWATVSTGSADFEIPAHGSRFFHLANTYPLKSIIAHAIIEWSADDAKLRKALIAGGWTFFVMGNSNFSHGNFLVNHGDPF
ncbi:hypothetical protein [Desulfovibrio gilichinskyi]|uniref:Uncharacterized protein n=1 Tax=Desulfovibrio gilichinskyi TaxID=1519643 RepID=A0A1X7CGK5_9BACT|nr:hypothetical protein [Desulfovibrio gilichinskyi]SME96175.1 hypothetical protein SAMN06295933_0868 [Desulfovibrio gilichinskyi]